MSNTNRADLEKIIRLSHEFGATDCDAILSEGNSLSMSAQNGELDSYKISGSKVIGIRVIKDNRVGLSYTEAFDDESLKQTVRNAIDNSQYAPIDECETIANSDSEFIAPYDEVESVDISEKIDLALKLESEMRAKSSLVSAVPYNGFSEGFSTSYYLNSKNVYCEQKINSLSCYTSALIKEGDKNSMYYHGSAARNFKELNYISCIEESYKHAFNWLSASQIPTGQYDVIFTVNELESLFGSFLGIFSAKKTREKSNPFSDKMGTSIASSLLTIIDSPAYENAYFQSYFDSEGFKQADLKLIDKGNMTGEFHNSATAKYFSKDNTYRAARGAKSSLGVSGTNILIKTGESTVSDVQSGTYLEIHQMQGLQSGLNFMSGDFSFAASGYLCKDGEIIQAVNGVTVAGNFYKIIKEISCLSNEEEISTGGSFFSPKIRFSNLTIAGK